MSHHHPLHVVCHDQRSVVTGTIQDITDTGCVLLGDRNGQGPVFPQKTEVVLNILDESSGQSINVRGRLTGFLRDHAGIWTYRIRWKQVPAFLTKHAA
jgi:hypothetical protein